MESTMRRNTSQVLYQQAVGGWRAYCHQCDWHSQTFQSRAFALSAADEHNHP